MTILGIRGNTLILLRWIAICGQTLAVVFVHFGLQLDLPLQACLLTIAASAWLNVYLSIIMPSNRQIPRVQIWLQLAFDMVQMAVLIGLTGGLANPFLVLFIAPVIVSVTALKIYEAGALFLLLLVLTVLMSAYALPLPWPEGIENTASGDLYKWGMISATLITTAFTAIYVWKVAREKNQMAEALAATEAVLAKEQQLAALGGLAAATAHELGTPLGTIALVAGELNRELVDNCPMREDVELILSQAKSCRAILSKLSVPGAEADPFHAKHRLSVLVEEISAQMINPEIAVRGTVQSKATDGASDEPNLVRLPEIHHALTAFTENAISFANSKVEIIARWDNDWVEVIISDDGPGFAPNILPRLGAPYVSTRRGGNEKGQGGLGLGFFISKNLIERTGGKITCGNSDALGGAMVQVVWPRDKIEVKDSVSGH